jgi:hypothetical protein
MAKYTSGGGGEFRKFNTIGDEVEGTLLGVRLSSKEFNGKRPHIADFQAKDGTRFSIDLEKKILLDIWFNLARPQVGEYVRVAFTGTVPSKQGQPAKVFEVEIPARRDGHIPPIAPTLNKPDLNGEYQEIVAALIAAKGEPAARSIETAVKTVAKSEAEQLKLLRQAAGR